MRKATFILATVLGASPLWAAGNQCVPRQDQVIDSEVHCVDSGGISIGLTEEDGAKVACMQNQQVRGQCGPDGELTRQHAYAQWLKNLKTFEDSCEAQGGKFSYDDPNFKEPQDPSYCLQAVPEIGSNMFEEPLCNYRSACPAVTVSCQRTCAEHTLARLD